MLLAEITLMVVPCSSRATRLPPAIGPLDGSQSQLRRRQVLFPEEGHPQPSILYLILTYPG